MGGHVTMALGFQISKMDYNVYDSYKLIVVFNLELGV